MHMIYLLKCLAQGINALVKLLQPSKESTADLHLAETVAVAITILSINNELNQDAVRSFSRLVRQVHLLGMGVTRAMSIMKGTKNGIKACSNQACQRDTPHSLTAKECASMTSFPAF